MRAAGTLSGMVDSPTNYSKMMGKDDDTSAFLSLALVYNVAYILLLFFVCLCNLCSLFVVLFSILLPSISFISFRLPLLISDISEHGR